MEYVLAIGAGTIQGLTEFLPISSTAHLIIFQKIFNLPQDQFGLTFDASIHLGTLLAVLIFFAKEYSQILDFKNQLLTKLILGTIPAVILGVIFEGAIENEFRNLTVIGITLVVFSLIMVLAEKVGKRNKKDEKISRLDSLIIGVAQSIALIPGVSRSGSTISAGLFLGQTRQSAARFAFLLSGPIIAGAGLKKFAEAILSPEGGGNIDLLLVGIVSSFTVGYLTIKYFLKFLATNNLYPFIIYRVILGLVLMLLPFLVS